MHTVENFLLNEPLWYADLMSYFYMAIFLYGLAPLSAWMYLIVLRRKCSYIRGGSSSWGILLLRDYPELNQKYWSCVSRFLGTFSPRSKNVVCSVIPYGAITFYLVLFLASIIGGICYPHFKSLDTNSAIFSLLVWDGSGLPWKIAYVNSLSLYFSGNFSNRQIIPSLS